MQLSPLQKYILLSCLNAKNYRLKREFLAGFYRQRKIKPQDKLKTKIITRSLERLINREFLVGYGVRTPHKWFIREVKLTAKGRVAAKQLLGRQVKLPFKEVSSIKFKRQIKS